MFRRVGFCGNGECNPMFGRIGIAHPAYGRKHSDDTKKKLSVATTKAKKGTTHSEETKQKMRVAILKRIEELGIPPKEDRGARIFFDNINKLGYKFTQKRFMNIGYDADGYDEQKHIWCELDTPYHNVLNQRRKDCIRQKNIINHFECEGTPLKAFIRITADKTGNVLESKCVYKDGKNIDAIMKF